MNMPIQKKKKDESTEFDNSSEDAVSLTHT